jgi:quinoprotein glucose dehydrogenase
LVVERSQLMESDYPPILNSVRLSPSRRFFVHRALRLNRSNGVSCDLQRRIAASKEPSVNRFDRRPFLWIIAVLAIQLFNRAAAQQGAPSGQWPSYGGDAGSTKYSALDQITKDNVWELQIAWRWSSPENERIKKSRRMGTFAYEATPVMIDGVLYTSSSHCDVIAINAASGETIWSYDSESWKAGRPTNLGFVHRGVTYWADGDERRVFLATHDSRLIALDADNGEPIASFGDNGSIDLTKGLRRPVSKRLYGVTSPPVVCRSVVVVGSSISDGPTHQEMPPGDVRGFDARTGQQRWVFQSIPQEGEFGNGTWEAESWKYTGNANCWTLMSADDEHGYVYVPFGTPTNDWYGGHRPGQGLFGESLVCLDAETGQRVWHFQQVHHGVWDYDLCAAPALANIKVDGRDLRALAQVTKQGFCWVLDRTSGQPVWPVEERSVPQSDAPDESTWPTQPFPTKPEPYELQGVTEDDLIDFTPELRAEALKKLSRYNYGPLYTPPNTEKPTINMPGWGGGGNWFGCSFDAETGRLYIPSMRDAISVHLSKPDPPRSNFNFVGRLELGISGPQGLPMWKPPYSSISCIDLHTGETSWRIPVGDGPRHHPALKDLDLPQLGDEGRPFPLTTKTLLLIAHASSHRRLYAYDKLTGDEISRMDLPETPQGAIITYMEDGKQYIVIPVGGRRDPSGLVALTLP